MKKLLFSLIFSAVGIGLSIWGYSMLKQAKASLNWPVAQGEILSSDVSSHRGDKGNTMYSPSVNYQYDIDGKNYRSSKVTASDYSSSSSKHAYKIVQKYPKGMQVNVFYDPENPYESMLEPGATWFTYVPFGMGVLFLSVGVMTLFSGVLTFFKKILRLFLFRN